MRGCREEELIFGPAWPSQPQAPEPKDAFEMGKQHLDFLPAATSRLVFRRRGESPGNVSGVFMQITRNLAGDRIRAATRLKFANVAVLLAGAVEACAFGGDVGPWGSVSAPELDQLFASRARISVPFGIEGEVGARKRSVHPSGLVEDGNVRRSLLLFDEPRQALGRTIGTVGGQILRLQAEAILRSLEHGASRANLGLANCARGFNIDNHPVVGVDQIIGGVGKKGMALVRPRPLRRWIGRRNELRRHSRRRAESGIVQRRKVPRAPLGRPCP